MVREHGVDAEPPVRRRLLGPASVTRRVVYVVERPPGPRGQVVGSVLAFYRLADPHNGMHLTT